MVFDFDGVLADTERLHLAAYQRVFSRRGWSLDERTYFERYLGYDDASLIRMFAGDLGVALTTRDERTLLTDKTDAYLELLRGGQCLYPGAAACVRAAGARYLIAIASGSLRAEILHILEGNGLVDAFQSIVSAEDVARCKPAPDAYVAAARGLGLAPAACLAIEDSARGIDAARAAGMKTIALTTTSPASQLTAAHRVLARVDDVTVDVIAGVLAA